MTRQYLSVMGGEMWAERKRGICRGCGEEFALTTKGVIWAHPNRKSYAETGKLRCDGVGLKPRGCCTYHDDGGDTYTDCWEPAQTRQNDDRNQSI